MNNNYIKQLDPVQGLINYILDVKPYHTKVIDVLVEYVYTDKVLITANESLKLSFDGDFSWVSFSIYQLNASSNTIFIIGDITGVVSSGQQIRVYGSSTNNKLFTITGTPTFNGLVTQLQVMESISYQLSNIIQIYGPSTIVIDIEDAPSLIAGDFIEIVDSTGNDGTYTVKSINAFGDYYGIELEEVLPDSVVDGIVAFNQRGGFIYPAIDPGITLIFSDRITVRVAENAQVDAIVDNITGSPYEYPVYGSPIDFTDYHYPLVGGWDAQPWDSGMWDISSFQQEQQGAELIDKDKFGSPNQQIW